MVVAVEVDRERVEQAQAGIRAIGHRDRHRPVERHDGGGPDALEFVVQGSDLRPVRVLWPRRAVMAGRDRRLEAVRACGGGRVDERQPFVDQLVALARTGFGLAITPSRRTGATAEQLLRERLAGLPAFIWDGAGENPYFGLLGLADAIIATEDSVSMVSEAAATAAPVLLAGLPGRSRRIRMFNELLIQDGRVRPFTGRLEMWPVQRLDDTLAAGQDVRRRLGY